MITQVESVGLVIQLLHDSKYRDKTLHVERVSEIHFVCDTACHRLSVHTAVRMVKQL